jgi:hypothetical protein
LKATRLKSFKVRLENFYAIHSEIFRTRHIYQSDFNKATEHSNIYPARCNVTQFILTGNSSTCFGWYYHPSSGAQTTASTASDICPPDGGRWYRPKHVDHFADKINCVTLHLAGYDAYGKARNMVWSWVYVYVLFSKEVLLLLLLLLLLLVSTYALQPSRLIVRFGLDVSTFATWHLHACHYARALIGGRWNFGQEMSGNFA